MATHGVVPESPIITKQTYASPMSYVGSTRRMITWARKRRAIGAEVIAWTAVVLGLVLAWVLLAAWYFIIFVVSGLFVIVTGGSPRAFGPGLWPSGRRLPARGRAGSRAARWLP